MQRFSHSRLNTFENCSLQFKYRYVDKIRTDVESIEAFMGKRVHETMERLYEDKMHQRIPSVEELVEHYHELWEKHWHGNIRVVRKRYTPENYRDMGEEYIRTYYDRYHPFDQEKTLGIEEKVLIQLEDGKYQILGYIDRLAEKDGVYEIHDYKTGNYIPSRKSLENDRQLSLYSIAVKNRFPDAEQVAMIWHYMAHDKEIRVEPDMEDLEKARKDVVVKIEEVLDAIEEEDFEPTISKLCNWCEYKEICPEWKHVYQANQLPANQFMGDDGVKLVNKYATLKAKKDTMLADIENDLDQALMVYALKNQVNRVTGSDVVAEVEAAETVTLPEGGAEREKLRHVLQEAGILEEVSSIDANKLERFFQDREDEEKKALAEKVVEYVDVEKTPRIQLEDADEH